MVTLDELIKNTVPKDIDITLKKSFSDLSDPVIIDGRELDAIVILTNLSLTGKKELLDRVSLEYLSDTDWQNSVLKPVAWLHTHNLKYPDIKADGCIFFPHLVLAKRKIKVFGYAKNSNLINKCKFMITEFFWKDSVTSLVEQFAKYKNEESSLIDLMVEHGFPKNRTLEFTQKSIEALEVRVPESVHRECKQARFIEKNGEFLSVTPVVRTSNQRIIHNLAKEHKVKSTIVYHHRPTSLGSYVSACGGRVRCLYYPPRISQVDSSIDHLIIQWRTRKHLLNERALLNKKSLNILFQIIRDEEYTSTVQHTKKSNFRNKQNLYHLLESLFSEIFYLRVKGLDEIPMLDNLLDETIEKSVINECFDLKYAEKHFTRQVNEILEYSKEGKPLAYEPALIEAMGTGIRHCLSNKRGYHKPAVDSIYLHFEKLMAYGANSQSNPYLVGLPSLTAVAGFVDAFIMKLGVTEVNPKFAIALHQFECRKGHPLSRQVYRQKKVRNGAVIDSQHCDFEFDLIIRLSKPDSSISLDNHNLIRCLPKRFAGGVLGFSMHSREQKGIRYKKCHVYNDEDALSQGVKILPNFLRFITGTNQDYTFNDINELSDILENPHEIIPVNKGFIFLGLPRPRDNAIAKKHVYSEPVLGLAKLLSPQSLITRTGIRELAFWQLNISRKSVEVVSGDHND